jgi:nicotinate-nucleotide--dimethylbenzimidazole phosphoribosyltransferase
VGASAGGSGLVALGEVGVGNTTVAAALVAALLGAGVADVVGRGAGSDSAMVATKRRVVAEALWRWEAGGGDPLAEPLAVLRVLGGPEVAILAGVVLGAARVGAAIVLDGVTTSVAALVAVGIEPAASAHLVAGQRSREPAHPLVLDALGLEPLLDLRLRAGEGAGAAMAVSLLRAGLAVRADAARVAARA